MSWVLYQYLMMPWPPMPLLAPFPFTMHLCLSLFSLMNPIIFKSHLSLHVCVCVCERMCERLHLSKAHTDMIQIWHICWPLARNQGGLIEQWRLRDRERMTGECMKRSERVSYHRGESITGASTRQMSAICKGIWREKQEGAREKGVNCLSEWNERQRRLLIKELRKRWWNKDKCGVNGDGV